VTPLVSVIMPVRNGGEFLGPAVQSILEQSQPSLELLLVDDHSTDGAIGELSKQDTRLIVMSHQGQGVSAAFNAGFARASGRFIARMDADDLALPERLDKQLGYLQEHPEIALCGACVEIFSEQEVAGGNKRYQAWLNNCRSPGAIRREIFIESPIPNPTAMFRSDTLNRLGGFHDPCWPEDYDLYLRADAAGMKMGKPSGCLLQWREHPGRLTRTDPRYAQKSFQAAKAHYLADSRLATGKPVVIWGAGPSGRLMHDLLQAKGVAIEGFLEVHPRRIGGQKRGLPVWPLDQVSQLKQVMILVAVGAAGVRPEIRTLMESHAKIEGEDYLFVA
jgi:cellulose synthase/poly-beta-1,6-N-acetylglucosamine synthase-like glycosyltransferase